MTDEHRRPLTKSTAGHHCMSCGQAWSDLQPITLTIGRFVLGDTLTDRYDAFMCNGCVNRVWYAMTSQQWERDRDAEKAHESR